MNIFLNITINVMLLIISQVYFTCEKQKKSSVLIVFLSFYALCMLNYITGTTEYIYKVIQIFFLFFVSLKFLKGNYKNIVTGLCFSLLIQKIVTNIPYTLRFLIDKEHFLNEINNYIGRAISLNILFILIFFLMVKLIDITALKKYIQESNIAYVYIAYIVVMYILLYFEYYFFFGEHDYIIRMYVNFFTVVLPIVTLIHTYIKLSSYKLASKLNEEMEIYVHEQNQFFE